MTTGPIEPFISRWTQAQQAERTNSQSFLNELCDLLAVERPRPGSSRTGGDYRSDSALMRQ